MKLLLALTLLTATLRVLHSVPAEQPKGAAEELLKQLSSDGEKLVGEEVRRALYGVKQIKEVMWTNEQKHEHLMKSLRSSGDKKKGAALLTKEVTEKLEEAEEQCKDSLQSEWEQCRPCLEDACKTFYTSNCRRGFSAFHTKVGNFFQRVSQRFGSRQSSAESEDILVNQSQDPDGSDADVIQIEESFDNLVTEVGLLVNRSIALVSRMSSRLDKALQTAFLGDTAGTPTAEPTVDPYDPGRDSGFIQGVGLDQVLESFYDFGRSVAEEFGAVVTQVFDKVQKAAEEETKKDGKSFPRFLHNRMLCRSLRKQTSECWRLQSQCEACQGTLLTECPSVRELHVELDEVSQLLEVSREQFTEILSIVQQHTDQTLSWLSNMLAEFSWVTRAFSNSTDQNLFRVTMVAPESQEERNDPVLETKVEVNILNSAPVVLTVPGGLRVRDPAFIQYVIQEALDQYKQTVRFEDV